MGKRPRMMTVTRYFELPETVQPMELVYGVVREPPAPRYGHQSAVTRLASLLDAHVREQRLGHVCVSPVDVVLDESAALVVQPDIVFVSRERSAIIRDRIWGPPDLAVEVLSPRTALRDRTVKVGWYRRYGVGECWLLDVRAGTVDVYVFGPRELRCRFEDNDAMQSRALPGWSATPASIVAR